MTKIGDLVRAKEIGVKGSNWYIWATCIDCGKERWSKLKDGRAKNPCCRECASNQMKWKASHRDCRMGAKSSWWKRGIRIDQNGYRTMWISPYDPYFPMADGNKYVREHRLIMARSLGRCLQPNEHIHHINSKKLDNRLENLFLTTTREHPMSYTAGYKVGFADGYAKCKQDLEKQGYRVEVE